MYGRIGFGYGFGFAPGGRQGALLNLWENLSVVFKRGDAVNVLQHSYENKAVALAGTTLKYSSDGGASYNAGVNLAGTLTLRKARILSNGIIILTDGKTKLYYSNDNLATISQCPLLGLDGNTYVFHTPVNATYPGQYLDYFGGFIDTGALFMFGNYTNNSFGASPVNLYYSLDGITWQVFYTFGQNPLFKDDGTAMGGETGNILGNELNTLLARHVHSVNLGYDGSIYVSTGDNPGEIHILKCDYIAGNWVINDLLTTENTSRQRFRALGAYYRSGFIYWGSDAAAGTVTIGGIVYNNRGIFKARIGELNDFTKHILLQEETDPLYAFVNVGNIVFASYPTEQYIRISTDYGNTWNTFNKPAYMTGTVDVVYYNTLYQYFKSANNTIMEIKPYVAPNGIPYGLAGIATNSRGLILTWNSDITDESNYHIERSLDGITYTEIGTTAADVLTYTDNEFTTGVNNYYRVRASRSGGYSEYATVTVNANFDVELVEGPDFSDPSKWDVQASWSIANGKATYSGATNNQHLFRLFTGKLELNSYYKIEFDILDCVGTANFKISLGGANTFSPELLTAVNGSYAFIAQCIYAPGGAVYLRFTGFTVGSTPFSVDNFSIKKVL